MRFFFKWPRKISWKLTITYTIMFILVLLVLNCSIYFILKNFVEDDIRESIDSTMKFVLSKIQGVDKESFSLYEADILHDISSSEGDVYFRVIDYKNEIVGQSTILKGIDIPLKAGYIKLEKDQRQYLSRSIIIAKYGFLNGYLQVVRDVTFEYHFLKVLLIILIITSVIGSIGAAFAGYSVTKRSLKPINQITNTARNISVSDLGKRLEINGPDDELTNLARTFNSMLERLEKSFKRQQQFVSDASHELRTPISVIQGYIDLLDRWGKDEAEIRDEAIEAIKNEVQQINILLESLLFMARGDSDNLEINKSEFMIDKVIDELVHESSMIAEGIKIYSQHNDSVNFLGDRRMIKQLLRIFVDNSLKFTPEGGKVIINAEDRKDAILLSVIDTGIGIPEEDIPYIFERFYQVDKVRSRKNSGSGLGLAIARWIIDIHDGKAEVSSEVGEGTEIRVLLPKNL